MEVWSHDGNRYELNSYYSLPDDAWQYELVGVTEVPGTGLAIPVAVPDLNPADGPFTPGPAHDVAVHVGGGQLPWPLLQKLINLVEASGDLVDELRDLSAEGTALPLTLNTWWHDDQQFEVNQHHGDDSWCYELYRVQQATEGNDYIDVRIPDASPDSGPFIPGPVSSVLLTVYGDWTIPWPIFRRFVDALGASGDIVEAGTPLDLGPAAQSGRAR